MPDNPRTQVDQFGHTREQRMAILLMQSNDPERRELGAAYLTDHPLEAPTTKDTNA